MEKKKTFQRASNNGVNCFLVRLKCVIFRFGGIFLTLVLKRGFFINYLNVAPIDIYFIVRSAQKDIIPRPAYHIPSGI